MFEKSPHIVTIILLAISALSSASEEAEVDPEKGFTISYAAPAEDRTITALVYIQEPHELKIKQNEDGVEVQAETNLVSVIARPVAVPENLQKPLTAQLRKHSEAVLKKLESGPLLGPDRAFVLFDKERVPRYIVHIYNKTLVSARCKFVSPTIEVKDANKPLYKQIDKAVFTIGDLFQELPNTKAVVSQRDIRKFLQSLPSPVANSRTPFRGWIMEKGKASRTLENAAGEENNKPNKTLHTNP